MSARFRKTAMSECLPKQEILLPLMDKDGVLLKHGDAVYYSELPHSNYADQLGVLSRDGEFLKMREILVYNYCGEYLDGGPVSRGNEEPSIEFWDLDITAEGTRCKSLKKVDITGQSDFVEFMNLNFPLK